MTTTTVGRPWAEKYRPRKLSDVVAHEDIRRTFQNMVETTNVPHLLLYGPPGTGKTSTIKALGHELYGEHFSRRLICYNASDDRGIDAVRDKICPAARATVSALPRADGTMTPPVQIIMLDEADAMTSEGQDALRVIIERYSHITRFVFVCNYIDQITEAIKSRCTHVYFPPVGKRETIRRLKDLGEREELQLSNELYNTIAEVSAGDLRRAIVILQQTAKLVDYRSRYSRPLCELSVEEFRGVLLSPNSSSQIVPSDIYDLAATPRPEEADQW